MGSSGWVCRRVTAFIVTCALVGCGALASVQAPLTYAVAVTSVSLSSDDVVDAGDPSISADGRFVVFGGTSGQRRSLFRTDRVTGDTIEISPLPPGVRTGDTIHGRLSADGCVVVAVTQVPFDLFRDDDKGERWDVYRLVVQECGGNANAWELVSISTATGTASDAVFADVAPTVSGSGAVIAFSHPLADAPDGVSTISVVDITIPPNERGRVQQVAGIPVESPNRAFLYHGATQPAISQNGRHLAFRSDSTASEALPGWGEGPVLGEYATSQVYVWDRAAVDQRRAVRLISGRDGFPSTAGADQADVSEDGRFVVFASADRTLVPAEFERCTTACPSQIYRFDRDADRNGIFDEPGRRTQLAIVSAVDAGVVGAGRGLPIAGNGASWAPALNAEGSQVAFVTDATNLLASRRAGGGTASDGDLLVAEVQLGKLRRVIDGADATAVPGAHGNPALSKTGQVIAFDTMAGARIPGTDWATNSGSRAVATVAVTPQLSLAELDFGSTVLGFESGELFATVLNAGPAAFEPAAVLSSSPNFKITGGTCAKGVIVAAGASCSVKLTFNPTEPRAFSATISVTGTGFVAPTISTTVRGAAGLPALEANPGGVQLDPEVVGGSGGRVAIDITNIAFVPTEIARVQLGGAHPGDFVVVTQSCTRRALNPDASCAIEVEFRPKTAGYRSALLLVTTIATEFTGAEYTSAVIGGLGLYEPTFEATTANARPGATIGVRGGGFPGNVPVSIGFDDGATPFATVQSTANGAFLNEIVLPTRTRIGERRLVATAPGGVTATIVITIEGRPNRTATALPGFGLG